MEKEITINGKTIIAQQIPLTIKVENKGKLEVAECFQYVNEHGFEVLLLNSKTLEEIKVESRPLTLEIRVDEVVKIEEEVKVEDVKAPAVEISK